MGSLIFGFSSIVVYAKYDTNFRYWLKNNLYGSDEFLKLLFFEDKSASEQQRSTKSKYVFWIEIIKFYYIFFLSCLGYDINGLFYTPFLHYWIVICIAASVASVKSSDSHLLFTPDLLTFYYIFFDWQFISWNWVSHNQDLFLIKIVIWVCEANKPKKKY